MNNNQQPVQQIVQPQNQQPSQIPVQQIVQPLQPAQPRRGRGRRQQSVQQTIQQPVQQQTIPIQQIPVQQMLPVQQQSSNQQNDNDVFISSNEFVDSVVSCYNKLNDLFGCYEFYTNSPFPFHYYYSTENYKNFIEMREYDYTLLENIGEKIESISLFYNNLKTLCNDLINKLKENVREGLSDSFNSMYIRSTHREPRHMNATGREDDSDYEQDDNEEANESMEQEREERDTQSQDMMNRFPTADENDGTMNEFNDKVNEHLNREEERRRKIEEDKKQLEERVESMKRSHLESQPPCSVRRGIDEAESDVNECHRSSNVVPLITRINNDQLNTILNGKTRNNIEFNTRIKDEEYKNKFVEDVNKCLSEIQGCVTRSDQFDMIRQRLGMYRLSDNALSILFDAPRHSMRKDSIAKENPSNPIGRPSINIDDQVNEAVTIIGELIKARRAPRLQLIATILAERGYRVNYHLLRKRLMEDSRFEQVEIKTMDIKRLEADKAEIKWFYDKLGQLHNIPAEFVANADEGGYNDWVDQMKGKAFVLRGMSNVFGVKRSSKRSTLMGCVFLDGSFLKLYYIISRKTVDTEMLNTGLTSNYIDIERSATGFINSELFEHWFKNVFVKEIQERRKKFNYYGYAVLLIDGCSSHLTTSIEAISVQNKIIIGIIPAHSSHWIQCLDNGLFGIHKKVILSFNTKSDWSEQTNQLVKNYSSWQKVATVWNITRAFEAVGIFIETRKENGKYTNYMWVKPWKITHKEISSLFNAPENTPTITSVRRPTLQLTKFNN